METKAMEIQNDSLKAMAEMQEKARKEDREHEIKMTAMMMGALKDMMQMFVQTPQMPYPAPPPPTYPYWLSETGHVPPQGNERDDYSEDV
jgi:hypothetical protein